MTSRVTVLRPKGDTSKIDQPERRNPTTSNEPPKQ